MEKPEIIIIAAMSENRVIGKNNALPWSLKEDLAHFKKLTADWPCIMGRKTWESLPRRPLPGRLNIVISGTLQADDVPVETLVFPSLTAAIEYCAAGYQKVFICGGEAVYREALPLAAKIELTMIHQHCEGDAFFPEIENDKWAVTGTENFDRFSFISYTKKPVFSEAGGF